MAAMSIVFCVSWDCVKMLYSVAFIFYDVHLFAYG